MPNTKILDAPFVIDQGADLGKWSPTNYTNKFYGLSTMRLGLEKSRNLMTIRLAQMIGIESIVENAKKLNISDDIDLVLYFKKQKGVLCYIFGIKKRRHKTFQKQQHIFEEHRQNKQVIYVIEPFLANILDYYSECLNEHFLCYKFFLLQKRGPVTKNMFGKIINSSLSPLNLVL